MWKLYSDEIDNGFMVYHVQEASLYEELHPHSPLPVIHPEGHRSDHEGRGAL